MNWDERANYHDLRSVIDPADSAGHKNRYIDFYQHMVLKRALCDLAGKSILDLGCGIGRFRNLARTAGKYVGVDSCRAMLQEDAQYGECNYLPFPDESFDVVLSVWTLQYQPDLKECAQEIKRVLKPNGFVVMIEQITGGYDGVLKRDVSDYNAVFGGRDLVATPIMHERDLVVAIVRRGLIPEFLFPVVAEINLMLLHYFPVGQYADWFMIWRK